MISSYGEETLKILKVANKAEGKNLFTLEQMAKVEGTAIVIQKMESDLTSIEQILEVIVDNPRFGGSQDNKFIVESLTLAKEFFSGIIRNGKRFDADSFTRITNFVRILMRQIRSSYTYRCCLAGISPI